MTYAEYKQKSEMPYEEKIKYAAMKADNYYVRNKAVFERNVHISVGGLDSITLLLFLRSLNINVPAISVSSLEDRSIQAVHKELGVEKLKPYMSKVEVIEKLGYPIISKEKAGKIQALQNPTERNATVRHAIMTGDTGKQGGYRKGTRMRLPKKWLELFAGMENEKYGTSYQQADFLVSNKCCYYMKEKPCDDWAKEHNSVPYLGMMASEGGQREKALIEHGCNYYGKTTTRQSARKLFHCSIRRTTSATHPR